MILRSDVVFCSPMLPPNLKIHASLRVFTLDHALLHVCCANGSYEVNHPPDGARENREVRHTGHLGT